MNLAQRLLKSRSERPSDTDFDLSWEVALEVCKTLKIKYVLKLAKDGFGRLGYYLNNSKTDWKWVQTNWAEEAFLKEDPRLRIRVRWDDEGVHVKGFVEPWANKHPDPTANSYWYDLTYDGALIERFILVSVDGARAELPLPDRNTLQVEPLIYKVAQIFDGLNTLEEYMRRSGLSVKSA